jgi:RHS repeat-associated protein
VEKENTIVQSDTNTIWCQTVICEERTAEGTPTRRSFSRGQQLQGASAYVATDHLLSVVAVTNNAGSLLTRYSYDPWGAPSMDVGTESVDGRFAGLGSHGVADLQFAVVRQYLPELGRWLNDDPSGALGPDGPNLYRYAANAPILFIDPLGLNAVSTKTPPAPPQVLPKGCGKAGSTILCQPPGEPRMCAATTKRCIPVFDRGLYAACLLYNAPALLFPSPGGTKGAAGSLASMCAGYATRCLGDPVTPLPEPISFTNGR